MPDQHLILTVVFNLIMGVGLGAVGGLLGIGGGLIAIPVLTFLYGMDQHLAQGTALVMITPNVLIGFIRYRQRNQIDMGATGGLAVATIITSFISARFASMVGAHSLQFAFAIFLIVLAVYFLWQLRARASTAAPKAAVPKKFIPAVGVLSGAMSGLFTVGGGLVAVPALVSLFGATQMQAQAMALALVIPGSIVALFTYAHAGHVSWITGIPLAIGGITSVSWGVALAHKFSPLKVRVLFCSVLVATAVMMLLQK
ncbi:sulfite exporter TauE/SafE family protein [Undibacterium sp. TJN25]|uniref:sulfite exporter TauE/SafE family protein n=1 Tax=Undibacterium sp. TJN25 TaxID=3413056 RepID=UPI003BF08468